MGSANVSVGARVGVRQTQGLGKGKCNVRVKVEREKVKRFGEGVAEG